MNVRKEKGVLPSIKDSNGRQKASPKTIVNNVVILKVVLFLMFFLKTS